MKKYFVMMFALIMGVGAVNAQEVKTDENGKREIRVSEVKVPEEEVPDEKGSDTPQEVEELTLQKDVYPQQEADGICTTV